VLALAQILAGTALLSGLYFTWRTLQVNREGQITERFTRAIEQLGSEKLEIRLGGIYALERIARESEEDYWPIMAILTAYVRQHAPRKFEEVLSEEAAPPGFDVQAILTIIGRFTTHRKNGEPKAVDLHETDLRRADLQEGYLQQVNFRGAILRGANLQRAILRGAILRGANLRGAILQETHDLTQGQIETTPGDESTQLPDHLEAPAHWTTKLEDRAGGH
jgi:Pentapeptide repeats (8 copies)